MDILDDMGVSKLSAKVFLEVNYFNTVKHTGSYLIHNRLHTIYFMPSVV